ncbi:formate dehydrogenase accessory protein FdhE [Comamonas sp. GB3 AK4-5]|uniref:formate dehydrogenase accessory protein FdhE n=1 Tax=Comamonas sp. GB3 AK4-5 TaxID=3231487 RepID=UPI00351DE749
MSIRIVPESERSPGVTHIPALQLPSGALPYAPRAARLRKLAHGHAMADYLLWAADLVDAQQAVAEAAPLPATEQAALAQTLLLQQGQPPAPLHSGQWPRSAHWLVLLEQLLQQLTPRPGMQGAPVQQALATLRAADAAQCNAWADALLAALRGDALPPDTGAALPDAAVGQLLWAALSLYWRQLAGQLPASGMAEPGEQRHQCPVCDHAPTASLVLSGAQAGLRYLQCSLCESQWHVVRTKCTSCDSTGALDYWCLEDEKAPIKAEACGDCHSYLKAFYLQADHQLELVADDLASLALDAEMEAKELVRSGVNPLFLPALA